MQLHRAVLSGVCAVAIMTTVVELHLLSPQTPDGDTGTAANQPRSPVTPLRPAGSANDMSLLREEVASLRSEILQLRKQQTAGSAVSAGSGRQPQRMVQNGVERTADSGADARTNEMTREEEAQQYQARIAAIDASFRKEAVDPKWSTSISSKIQNVLSSDEMGHMQADSIDCRSDSCRVELHDDGSGQLNKNLPMMAQELSGTMPNITANSVTRPDGSAGTVLYLSSQSQGDPPPVTK